MWDINSLSPRLRSRCPAKNISSDRAISRPERINEAFYNNRKEKSSVTSLKVIGIFTSDGKESMGN